MNTFTRLSYLLALITISYTTSFALVAMRSQTVDAARDMVGWTHETNLCCQDTLYGTIALASQYTKSINRERIARCLLGDCFSTQCPNSTFGVSGSRVLGRKKTDWLADYFGLPTDFSSTITIEPIVDSFLNDLNFYIGLDNVATGLFLKIQAPIVHMRTQINFIEEVTSDGVNGYAAGYFGPTAIARSSLLEDFEDFIGEGKSPPIDPDTSIFFNPLKAQRWGVPCSERLESTKLSDVEVGLGYNFLLSPDYHLGTGIVCRIPTGSRIKGLFLFEPYIGNGGHWELGALLTGHYTFWQGCHDNRSLTLSINGSFTHLFKAHQCRTFDLKNNGCSSKYMLAEKITVPVGATLFGNGTTSAGGPTALATQPNAQVQGIYTPVANLTHVAVTVKSDIQIDMAAMLTLTSGNCTLDLGYDFWLRSKEKICLAGPTPFNTQLWALKGDSYTYGFGASDALTGANESIALSATQSTATIFSGTNTRSTVNFNGNPGSDTSNPGIDNPQFGVTSSVVANSTDRINVTPATAASDLAQQRTSINPIFLTNDDIDIDKESNRAHSNKVFAHFNYMWQEEPCLVPYFGFGGFVEFAQTSCGKNQRSCGTTANKQPNCGISQWAIWLKTGFSY